MKKRYRCGNCKEPISEYRHKHSDRLCSRCWEIIYGCGDPDASLEEIILGKDYISYNSMNTYGTEEDEYV